MPIGHRAVVYFDKKNCDWHEAEDSSQKELSGHYERVSLTEPFYYYVNSKNNAAGNGVIVSDKELSDLGINPKDPNGSLLSSV